MSEHTLYLHPCDPAAAPDGNALREALRRIGFIATPLSDGEEETFRPGERFLHLLTFLGCSPVVALGEPGATGDSFCRIRVPETAGPMQFIGSGRAPRCPACRASVEPWSNWVEALENGEPPHMNCSACGEEIEPIRLNWRRSAGCARYFLAVPGIFEGEAVPSEELLSQLLTVTGIDWDYFYHVPVGG